jgi:hypothetical protein
LPPKKWWYFLWLKDAAGDEGTIEEGSNILPRWKMEQQVEYVYSFDGNIEEHNFIF